MNELHLHVLIWDILKFKTIEFRTTGEDFVCVRSKINCKWIDPLQLSRRTAKSDLEAMERIR